MLDYMNAKASLVKAYGRQTVSAIFILGSFYGLTSIGRSAQRHQEGPNFIFLTIDLSFLALFIWRYMAARRHARVSEAKMDEAVKLIIASPPARPPG